MKNNNNYKRVFWPALQRECWRVHKIMMSFETSDNRCSEAFFDKLLDLKVCEYCDKKHFDYLTGCYECDAGGDFLHPCCVLADLMCEIFRNFDQLESVYIKKVRAIFEGQSRTVDEFLH